MNRFEEMNVAEQQEICGGGIILPIWPIKFVKETVEVAVAGAVVGGVAGALNILNK